MNSMYWGNTMKRTIFYNTDPVAISTRLNEYMKSNFGYSVESDLKSLREAKVALEAQKREMKTDHQDRAYVENMLMLETIKSLLKAHVAEGKLPPALQAYQDKKNGKKTKDAKEEKVDEKAKPDFADIDGDGDKKEPMKKAAKDAKKKKVSESEKRWKQTSMSSAEATKKYGKENVKVKKGALRNGDDMVEVFVEGKYKSDAQRKAVHASKAEKANEGETPKFDTMKKYSNTYEAPKEYKMKKEKLEEGLLAQLNALLENDAAEAEITMAARGIVDELQDMIEKLGKIQNDQLGPLADEMAFSHGAEQSASFKEATDSAIAGLLGQARSTKDAVNNAVLTLTGQAPTSDMGATDSELGGDMGADMEDDISIDTTGADDSMAGPVDEPLGRAKR